MDSILQAITTDGAIRAAAATTRDLCEQARKIHAMSPTACAALGRVLSGAAIMSLDLKNPSMSITVQFEGGGPIGRITAVADGSANVKGRVTNPHADLPLNARGKLDVGGVVGRDGFLSVVREIGLKEPFVGQVRLVSGEIAEDLTMYFVRSEQIPTAMALGVLIDTDMSVRAAGGYMIQLLPGASEEDAAAMEKAAANFGAVTEALDAKMGPRDIIKKLLAGRETEFFEEVPTRFFCDCSRERTRRAIASVDKKTLGEMIEKDHGAEVVCRFCGNKYQFNEDELRSINS
ncbi:MAG: Hsp33 family molecular chaperone HslO [Clostridia bacterium]|nr:Hsp33 family molecular chaperone HslO [Clostridia bacterium]